MKTRILLLLAIIITIGFSCKPKTPVNQAQTQVSVQPSDTVKMILAKVFIKPGSEADFITAAQVMITNSNKEEGCKGYMLYQDPFEKTNFIFVERYKNQAAIDAHFATSYFKEFGPKIANIISKPTEIKILSIAGEK
jgi:quinol monooxygenase YgiN